MCVYYESSARVNVFFPAYQSNPKRYAVWWLNTNKFVDGYNYGKRFQKNCIVKMYTSKNIRISRLQGYDDALRIYYAVGDFLPQGRSSADVYRRARVLGVGQTAVTSITYYFYYLEYLSRSRMYTYKIQQDTSHLAKPE